MKGFLLCVTCILLASTLSSGQTAVVTTKDLKLFEGPKWTGTLTYLDYSSSKRTSIKSNLTVTRKQGKLPTWTFSYEYPDEPNANDSSEAVLADGGRQFFGENVIEKAYPEKKTLRLITTQQGTDNDKKALFKYTYLVSTKTLSIKKEVQLEGAADWFLRNEYRWMR